MTDRDAEPSVEAIERDFKEFADRCELTMTLVLSRTGNAVVEMRSWLFEDAAPDTVARMEIMHVEPLYLMAEFLGLDDRSPSFAPYVKRYQKLAKARAWHVVSVD
jgi:hypothetical protein